MARLNVMATSLLAQPNAFSSGRLNTPPGVHGADRNMDAYGRRSDKPSILHPALQESPQRGTRQRQATPVQPHQACPRRLATGGVTKAP
jgi:hypothetical protein